MLIHRLKTWAARAVASLAIFATLFATVPDLATARSIAIRHYTSGPTFLGGNSTFTSFAVEGNFGFGHWNGSNNFIYTGNAPYDRQGFNSWQGATPQTMTATTLAQFATTGAVMRIVVDPGPLIMGLQISQAQFNTLMAQIQAAVALNTAAGIRSIVDLSPRPTVAQGTGFGLADVEIVGAAPAGAFFTNYTATVQAVGVYLSTRDNPAWVALEVFNEPVDAGGVVWQTTAVGPIYTAARAGWPKGTLIISGNGGASPAGLALLTPSTFGNDPNIIYNFHSYDPYEVVFQSQPGAPADMAYVSGLEFPPNAANQANVIANATAAINGDGSLTGPQKTSAISAMTASINVYYSAPRGVAYTTALWAVATTWADSNSIARNRIWMGENSINGNSSFNYLGLTGATDDTVAAYLALGTAWAQSMGINRGYFDFMDSPGGGNGFSAVTNPTTPLWSNKRMQALGLPQQ